MSREWEAPDSFKIRRWTKQIWNYLVLNKKDELGSNTRVINFSVSYKKTDVHVAIKSLWHMITKMFKTITAKKKSRLRPQYDKIAQDQFERHLGQFRPCFKVIVGKPVPPAQGAQCWWSLHISSCFSCPWDTLDFKGALKSELRLMFRAYVKENMRYLLLHFLLNPCAANLTKK